MSGSVLVGAGVIGFGRIAEASVEGAVEGLARRLSRSGLERSEQEILLDATRSSVAEVVRQRLARTLLLELHAARLTGQLKGVDSAARWEEFIHRAARPEFLDELCVTYPGLGQRLPALIGGRIGAAAELADRLATDRDRLSLLGTRGQLVEVTFGAGDSHEGGRTVTQLRFEQGRVVYKPRSLAVDGALALLLADLQPEGDALIRVPRVLGGDDYGWAEFVEHEFCTGEQQVGRFYFAMGMWLAITRLLAGSDLHAENLIASGPVPVVVDCETLFTVRPVPSSAAGASREAWGRLRQTVAHSLLLPHRDSESAGVDMSALGALSGEQPQVAVPAVDGLGTDEARVVLRKVDVPAVASNHPVPHPQPYLFSAELLEGLREGVARIDSLDRAGRLAPALSRFAGCRLRMVPRGTQHYVELGRSLWHPVALRDQASVIEKVAGVLSNHAEALFPGSGDAVVYAEIAELMAGDVPVFAFTADTGRVSGPGGVPAGEHGDLIGAALGSWRDLDLPLEERIVRTSLGSILRGQQDGTSSSVPPTGILRTPGTPPRAADLQQRRAAVTRSFAEGLCRSAVWGEDGTVTWLGETDKCLIAPLNPNLYDGQAGVVLALAAYQHAVSEGAAEPLAEVPRTLSAAIRTLDLLDSEHTPHTSIGAYDGLAGLVSARLVLHRLGHGATQLDHARSTAHRLAQPITNDAATDVLSGLAGMIGSLITLAEHDADPGHLQTATQAACELAARAHHHPDGTSSWTTLPDCPDLGGFAHGATGIGWALARLDLATGDQRWADLAHQAFTYEATLHSRHGWRDMRSPTATHRHAWCHGSVGIGLAHLDLYHRTGLAHHRDIALRAADHALKAGPTRRHDPCHGDLATLELLHTLDPESLNTTTWTADLLTTLENHGPLVGTAPDHPNPSFMTGTAGILYQLLRTHPRISLLSVLTPGLTDRFRMSSA